MDTQKIIEERITKAFKKLSTRFNIPVNDLRIAITCKEPEKVNYAVYSKGQFINDIKLTDVADLTFWGVEMIGEKKVTENIENKFYLFGIPINAESKELLVYIVPSNPPQGFLYRNNICLNDKDKDGNKKQGFKIGSLF
jgi:hypothetical protein